MMTLDNFIDFHLKEGERPMYGQANLYVKEPGFRSLYVRAAIRLNSKQDMIPCLDIGSVVVNKPGRGTFKNLMGRLRVMYPYLPIYVENVFPEKLSKYLERIGFWKVSNTGFGSLTVCYMIDRADQMTLDTPKELITPE